jgi:hypothetical protein
MMTLTMNAAKSERSTIRSLKVGLSLDQKTTNFALSGTRGADQSGRASLQIHTHIRGEREKPSSIRARM